MNTPIKPSLRSTSSASVIRSPLKRGLIAIALSAGILAAAFIAFGLFVVLSAIFMSADVGQRHAALMKSFDPVAHATAAILIVACIAAIARAFSPAQRVLSWGWLIFSLAAGGGIAAAARNMF